MQHDDLKRLFNKFKKDELIDILLDKGFLDEGFRRTTATKASSVRRILKLVGEKLSSRQVALLDLSYHQLHPKSKEWDVFSLSGFDHERARGNGLSDSKIFETRICSKLQLYFNVDVCVQLYKDAMWIRLAFMEEKISRTSAYKDKVYLVHYPLSSYIMVTKMKAAYKQYILQTVADVLGCTELKQQKLSGKDVQSLADLLLNKKSQGSFSEFRLKKMDANPLCQGNPGRRKRRYSGEDFVELATMEENKEESENKERWVKNTFGSCDQPVLEKVKFTMETKFRGSKDQDLTNNPFRCTVKFEGPSVIEGIKNLGKTGAADVPLPPHLSNLHSLARNHFMLKDSWKRRREMDSLQVSQL